MEFDFYKQTCIHAVICIHLTDQEYHPTMTSMLAPLIPLILCGCLRKISIQYINKQITSVSNK